MLKVWPVGSHSTYTSGQMCACSPWGGWGVGGIERGEGALPDRRPGSSEIPDGFGVGYISGAGETPQSSFLIFVMENSEVCFEAIHKLALNEAQ